MNRIDQLPEEALTTTIKQLEVDAVEIKNKQFIGLDSVLFYQNDSGLTYDWAGTLPSIGGGQGAKMFTVESTSLFQQFLFADIIFEFYIGSIAPANKINFADEGVDVVEVTPVSDGRKSKRWAVFLNGDDTSTYFAKFYTITSGSADITVTA